MTGNLVNQLLLYAITLDGTELKTLLRQVEEALIGGATILQLREKNVDKDEYCRRAINVKKFAISLAFPLLLTIWLTLLFIATRQACILVSKILTWRALERF